MGQESGKQASPFVCDGELLHELGGQIIEAEDGISSPKKDPKHAHAVFGRGRAGEAIELVAKDMTVLIGSVDPRARAIQMLPGRTGEASLHDLCTLLMEEVLIFDQQIPKLPSRDREADRV